MNKLKYAILLLFVALGCKVASAQNEIFDSPDNHPYFGVRVGLDITAPTWAKNDLLKADLFDGGAGFHAGAVYNIPLWKNLYFEPGLGIYYNTIGYDLTTGYNSTIDCSIRRFGFRVPFDFGYHFDFEPCSVAVFTGPQIDLGLTAHSHSDSMDVDDGNEYGSDGLLNRFGLGWKFGAGVWFNRFVIEISGTVSMTDMMQSSMFTCHNNLVEITLGYNF